MDMDKFLKLCHVKDMKAVKELTLNAIFTSFARHCLLNVKLSVMNGFGHERRHEVFNW